MRFQKALLVSIMALAAGAQAAEKGFEVKFRQAIMQDGQLLHESHRQNCGFRVEIVSDSQGVKNEGNKNGRPYITACKGENYSVRIYNPLPVRVAVNLTVDGLNSISGKPCGISDGEKWMIDPYSTVTIPGWQVNGGEARRFFFTDKPKSYAKWQGDNMGKDLAANCGVIGAAYFWNQQELDQYYDSHPLYRTTYYPAPYSNSAVRESRAKMPMAAPAPQASGALQNSLGAADMAMKKEAREEQAGTGMGDRESHPTYQVSFDYNTGMYRFSQAVVIYYGFESSPVPNPFPELGYAPEMPLR